MDLGCLTEFKRNSSGAVEVKLNRPGGGTGKAAGAAEGRGEPGRRRPFLEALDRPQAPEGMCSRR